MYCTLGLDCAQMGLDECGECINEELCHRYTEAWNTNFLKSCYR